MFKIAVTTFTIAAAVLVAGCSNAPNSAQTSRAGQQQATAQPEMPHMATELRRCGVAEYPPGTEFRKGSFGDVPFAIALHPDRSVVDYAHGATPHGPARCHKDREIKEQGGKLTFTAREADLTLDLEAERAHFNYKDRSSWASDLEPVG